MRLAHKFSPVALLLVLLLASVGSAAVGGKMPDLKALGYVITRPLTSLLICESGKEVYAIGYNKKGRENSRLFDAVAMYASPKDPHNRPFAIVIFSGPSEIRSVYIDRNRDGKIDAEGQPGDPGVPIGPCGILDGPR